MIKKEPTIGTILGIKVNSTSTSSVLSFLASKISEAKKTFIVTPNPEFLVYGQNQPWFARILNSADISLPDGIGLVWAAKILGQSALKRIAGSDIAEQLLVKANQNSWQIGIVGARRGEIEERRKLQTRLKRQYPQIKIRLLEETKDWQSKPFQIVFACQGMGEQEKWISQNFKKSAGIVFMGSGGALDFLTGFASRAPLWVRRAGLEWLYRLIHQPWRLRRQLNLLKFVYLILKEKFFKND